MAKSCYNIKRFWIVADLKIKKLRIVLILFEVIEKIVFLGEALESATVI